MEVAGGESSPQPAREQTCPVFRDFSLQPTELNKAANVLKEEKGAGDESYMSMNGSQHLKIFVKLAVVLSHELGLRGATIRPRFIFRALRLYGENIWEKKKKKKKIKSNINTSSGGPTSPDIFYTGSQNH